MFWINTAGESPPFFSRITLDDLKNKKWAPTREVLREWCHKYLYELEKEKRFFLTIWPPHCLIGTDGHSVVPAISGALLDWELRKNLAVRYTVKGTNSLTEHYSAIKAEVVHPDDPQTSLNISLLDELNTHDKVVVAGQALSHCVNFTCRDLMDHWKGAPANVILLNDCASSVPGFEEAGIKFLSDMKDKGVTIKSSLEIEL
jgi:nicotinamidase-related amidase